MASRITKAYMTQGTHAVGNLNSFKVRTLNNGAKVITADIDNFTIGELGFASGERTVVQLTDETHEGVLVCSPERRFAEGEQLCDFYNEVGELARCVYLEKGIRFETSAYTLNTGVTSATNGAKVHFDSATKKFIVSGASAHADYATAYNQFVVVDANCDAIDGQSVIRLEVTK